MTNCPRKDFAHCTKSKKKHHISIWPPNSNTSIPNREVNHINIPKTNFTHLQTARVYITDPTGISRLTRYIFYGGSQPSFVDASLIDKLKLSVVSSGKLNVYTFESGTSSQVMRRCVQFSVSSGWDKIFALITVFESSNKYTSHRAAPADIVRFAKGQKLILADLPEDSNLPIKLLIGGDFYCHIVTTKSPIQVEDFFVRIPSIFGWVGIEKTHHYLI
ncbi:integrase catalytic domain-containing protein [Trichonephila clavata]|uniref:Integrase catalytic domain-containing protein n=1 Tax=Trichonephila clavata TaxID=2740835 RepID=A0A8X6IKE6_TRICU|nr:integrase catalytic domain-containing protein [Trichonephila clavata]